MASTRTRSTEPSTSAPKRRSAKAAAPRGARKARAAAPLPQHEEIARRAYAIFEAEGGGDRVEHWLRAERELAAGLGGA